MRPVRELPGGVRKLLDIAMALTGQPKLLLLDEPTSGVSADEKFSTMDTVVQAIEQEGGEEAVTVVFVEHDMDIVRRYATRVAAFYGGRVIADGQASSVLVDPEVQRHVTGLAPASSSETTQVQP
jgi:branched-chain amino acid transport system ATP-binding protein